MLTPAGQVSRARRPARERVAAALARRGARERLVLTLLLYERLYPIEVADTLGISLRQVERTYDCLLAELQRPERRGARTVPAARVRKAA